MMDWVEKRMGGEEREVRGEGQRGESMLTAINESSHAEMCEVRFGGTFHEVCKYFLDRLHTGHIPNIP